MAENSITYFDTPGHMNTDRTLDLAIRYARSSNIRKIVVASTKGDTAKSLMGRSDLDGLSVTIVTHAFGQTGPGSNPMPNDLRDELRKKGFELCSAAHALSGAERSLSTTFGGVYPIEIIANTLRMFGQGMKVCVEIAAMATDAGLVIGGEPIIAIGGTIRGADTAAVLRPASSSKILDTKVDRIICMPIE